MYFDVSSSACQWNLAVSTHTTFIPLCFLHTEILIWVVAFFMTLSIFCQINSYINFMEAESVQWMILWSVWVKCLISVTTIIPSFSSSSSLSPPASTGWLWRWKESRGIPNRFKDHWKLVLASFWWADASVSLGWVSRGLKLGIYSGSFWICEGLRSIPG